MLTTRPFNLLDITYLCQNMRACDVREVQALGSRVEEALLDGYARSDPRLVIFNKVTEPLAVFGVVPPGVIWMLATDELVDKYSREFLRKCRGWVEWLNTLYPRLFNIVDARNEVHIRWLEWCGFEFTGQYTINGHLFREFQRIKN